MKRKLLLCVLPILMALSACDGSSINESNSNLFQEDTIAHKELFGDFESVVFQKGIRNAYTPVTGSDPLIAVQSKTYTDTSDSKQYVAIRFVAAVNLDPLSTELYWERTLYAPDGSKAKAPTEPLRCEYKYSAIYDGSSLINVGSVEGDYNRFVTYTLRKIPVTKYDNYYLNVGLRIGTSDPTKIVSTSIDRNVEIAFPYTSASYFLGGNFNQHSSGYIPQDNPTLNAGEEDTGGVNYASFSVSDLKANDSFVIVNRTSTTFKVYDYSHSRAESLLHFSNDNGKLKAKYSGNHTLYLNKSNELHTESESIALTEGYYLVGAFSSWNVLPYYKIASGSTLPMNATVKFPHTGNTKIYHVNSSGATDHWYGSEGDGGYGGEVNIGHVGVYSCSVGTDSKYSISFARPLSFEIYQQWEPESDSTYIMFSNSSETTPTIGKSVKLSSFNTTGEKKYILYSSDYTYVHVSCVIDGEIKGSATVSLYDLKDHSYGFTENFYKSGDNYVCEILDWGS